MKKTNKIKLAFVMCITSAVIIMSAFLLMYSAGVNEFNVIEPSAVSTSVQATNVADDNNVITLSQLDTVDMQDIEIRDGAKNFDAKVIELYDGTGNLYNVHYTVYIKWEGSVFGHNGIKDAYLNGCTIKTSDDKTVTTLPSNIILVPTLYASSVNSDEWEMVVTALKDNIQAVNQRTSKWAVPWNQDPREENVTGYIHW